MRKENLVMDGQMDGQTDKSDFIGCCPTNVKHPKNTSKFGEKFIKNYDENSNIGYILEVDVEYPKRLHNLHNDLPFLPERMKIKKCHKPVCNLYDKNNYAAYIGTLNQALN